jgi:DNA-binding response OmpR family regulator
MYSFPTSSQQEEPRLRLLLAEDSLVLGEVLRFNLEQEGFDVLWALNGKEAIELFPQFDFDLVITDYEMPILNGEQVCDAIRNEFHASTPIIMCTAKGLELDFDRLSEKYSLSAMLQKPFSICELAALIRKLDRECLKQDIALAQASIVSGATR